MTVGDRAETNNIWFLVGDVGVMTNQDERAALRSTVDYSSPVAPGSVLATQKEFNMVTGGFRVVEAGQGTRLLGGQHLLHD